MPKPFPPRSPNAACTGQSVVGETVAAEGVQLRGGLVVNADVELVVIENAVAAGGKIVDKPGAGRVRELLQQSDCLRRQTVVGNQIACERCSPRAIRVSGGGIVDLVCVLAEVAIRDSGNAAG